MERLGGRAAVSAGQKGAAILQDTLDGSEDANRAFFCGEKPIETIASQSYAIS